MDKIQIVRVPSGPPLESAVDTLEKSSGYVRTPIFHDRYESELLFVFWAISLRQYHLTSSNQLRRGHLPRRECPRALFGESRVSGWQHFLRELGGHAAT